MNGMRADPRRLLTALVAAGCTLLLTGVAASPDQAQFHPLPDAESFLAEVREHLKIDPNLLDGHTYIETRTDADISFFGSVKADKTKVFQVFRSAEFGEYYKRLVSIDGRRLTREEIEAQDRRHRAERINAARRRARESEKDRAKRAQRQAEDQKKQQDTIEEVLGLFEYEMLGREELDDRQTIVVTFFPRPNVKPKTRTGKIMAKAKGRAWISEDDRQVIHVEATAFEDVTIGFGLIARLHAGSSIVVRRQLVNGRWLPAGYDFSGSGRTLLFRRFEIEVGAAYSDFQTLTADMLPFPPVDSTP